MEHSLVTEIDICIIAAWVVAVASQVARQPLLLAYLVAGFAIGPHGFKFITDARDIQTISEIGLSLLLFFVALQRHFGGPARGFATIVAGHVSVGMAYAAVMVHARLKDLDRSLEEAALDLGCRPLGVFFLVTLPLITQALGAAWLLTFTLSLDDVVTSAFLSGPGATTLPIVILSRARLGLYPTINAISTVTVAAVAIALCASTLLMRRHEQRRAVQVAGTG